MTIATVRLLDRLLEARVGHPIEDVPNTLRMVGSKDFEYLLV
jgi:hypothetical protein